MELSQDQQDQLKRLKGYFPYRIVFGAINPTTGEFIATARVTKRPMNELLRKGWQVWQLS